MHKLFGAARVIRIVDTASRGRAARAELAEAVAMAAITIYTAGIFIDLAYLHPPDEWIVGFGVFDSFFLLLFLLELATRLATRGVSYLARRADGFLIPSEHLLPELPACVARSYACVLSSTVCPLRGQPNQRA